MPTRPLIEAVSPVQPDLLAEIGAAATFAYNEVASSRPGVSADDVYRLGFCKETARVMVRSLSTAGHEISMERARVPVRLANTGGTYIMFHAFSALNPTTPKEIIIDDAWQQFLREPQSEKLPKVLVGNRLAFIARVQQHGLLEPGTANLWQPEAARKTLLDRHAAYSRD